MLYRLRKERPDVFDKVEGEHTSRTIYNVSYMIYHRQSIWTEECAEEQVRSNFAPIFCPILLTYIPDVLKALCLGAKAVGLGRPFLYAQSVRLYRCVSTSLSLMRI